MNKTEGKRDLGLFFGAISDPFATQLEKQGFSFAKEQVDRFQKFNDCIITLRMGGFLNDSTMDKIQQKLFNQIKRHVAMNNKDI